MSVGGDPTVPFDDITRKLDSDFFAGRWSRATDRQRELLSYVHVTDNVAVFGKDEVIPDWITISPKANLNFDVPYKLLRYAKRNSEGHNL